MLIQIKPPRERAIENASRESDKCGKVFIKNLHLHAPGRSFADVAAAVAGESHFHEAGHNLHSFASSIVGQVRAATLFELCLSVLMARE